ncbi:MAG TPA: DUF177 domain-containing protein [Longimicrobium sp.]|jgi:uncharacterized protein
MLKLNLAAVDREEVEIHEQVAADDPMWEGSDVRLVEPLRVDLTARSVGDDGVLLRGRIQAVVERECRRCLTAVRQPVDDTVDLFFAPIGEDEDELGGEIYPMPARGQELDVTEAVREQLLLRAPQYVVCSEECRGLCPQCGTNLNEATCDCVSEVAPSPWDALKQVKFD